MVNSLKKLFFPVLLCLISINLIAQSVGGTTSGSGLFCAGTGNGFISLSGHNGNSIIWESSTDTLNWTPTGTTVLPSQSYFNLTQTTCYRAVVQDGSFPPDTSTMSCIEIYLPSNGGTISGAGVSCISSGSGTGTLTLNGSVGDVLFWEYSTDNGQNWTNVADTTTSINHPNITQDTWYRAVVQSGSTCPTDTSDTASFTFDSVSVAGVLTGTDTICPGINNGTVIITGYVGAIVNWLSSTDGTSWNTITDTTDTQTYNNLSQTTHYQVVVQNGVCPADTSDSAILSIIPNVISAGPDTTIVLGESVVLNGTGNGTALWSPATGLDSVTIFTPTATPSATTTYTLTVTDNNSCISIDSIMVTTYSLEFDGMISNLFTPNGDGINDTWYIQNISNFPDNEVFVYNIYGNLVYNKKAYTSDWDGTYNGKPLPDGTYFFVLRFDDSELVLKGSIDILKNK
ncbi:MAG: gliding motility-associated C-terminal domain-containing protein [Bacteroidia bacterium]